MQVVFNQRFLYVNWRKALSSVNNGACVEVASARKKIAVRDSKDLTRGMLVYSQSAWRDFIATQKLRNLQ